LFNKLYEVFVCTCSYTLRPGLHTWRTLTGVKLNNNRTQ